MLAQCPLNLTSSPFTQVYSLHGEGSGGAGGQAGAEEEGVALYRRAPSDSETHFSRCEVGAADFSQWVVARKLLR